MVHDGHDVLDDAQMGADMARVASGFFQPDLHGATVDVDGLRLRRTRAFGVVGRRPSVLHQTIWRDMGFRLCVCVRRPGFVFDCV